MRIAAALLAVCLVAPGPAFARGRGKRARKPRPSPTASADAAGRSHLKKANALAAHNNCEAAIGEYTLAFDRLNDPAVLLARAECRRRAGQNAEAAADYRAYLDESPDVPNQAEIEAKIAALEAKPPSEGAPPKVPPPREVASPPPREVASPTPKEVASPKAPPRPEESVPTSPRPEIASPAPRLAPKADDLEAAPPQSPSVTPEVAVEVKAPPVEATSPRTGTPAHLWLWTAVAVLVAGGATVAGYFYFRPAEATPPPTTLGNYRF